MFLFNVLDIPSAQFHIFAGNKIDIPVAASEDELRHSLGLYTHMTSGHGEPMENPWKTHGKLENPWKTHGKPMENPWKIGKPMETHGKPVHWSTKWRVNSTSTNNRLQEGKNQTFDGGLVRDMVGI